MPKYIVMDGHKKHDGREYAPGDVVECSEEIAKTLRLGPVETKTDMQQSRKKST